MMQRLRGVFQDQRKTEKNADENKIRYIKTANTLIVFLLKKNMLLAGISKSDENYLSVLKILEQLYTQVFHLIT